MIVQSEVYAKPGELVQGLLPDNKPFLLSNKSSTIFKTITNINYPKVNGEVELNFKSKAAIELFWETLSVEQKTIDIAHLNITQQSNIPIGKGLSSSSADVLGVLNSLNVFYNANYSIEQLYKLATVIEPTDPCLHFENVLFSPKNGEVIQVLSDLPFKLMYFDSDIELLIDTIECSQKITYTNQQQLNYQKLYESIITAFENTDYTTFYNCLNKSADMNNIFLPKKNLHILQDFAFNNKVGLFVAHSGTYMGLVIEPDLYKHIEPIATEFINKHWNTPIYAE